MTCPRQHRHLHRDYNQNGLTDANEDNLSIPLADAQALVASGGGSDGVEKHGWDVVAMAELSCR